MQLIWIIFEILLVFSETLFVCRVLAVYKQYKAVKKRYCLAPDTVKAGHAIKPTRADYAPLLTAKRIELISWSCIALAGLYACSDCMAQIVR